MKCLLLASFVVIGLTATAQQPLKLQRLQMPVKPGSWFNVDTSGERMKATFSHNTSKGKIYTLSPDNMPCLVPDMKQVSRMPVYPVPIGNMPNLLPKQPVIPEEKKEAIPKEDKKD